MELLLEYRGSRRQITVSSDDSLTECVTTELRRIGRTRAAVYTANVSLESNAERDVYLLQKWSPQWDCYVDVRHVNEVQDGDRLTVVGKPKPPSKLLQLLCCCCASPDLGVALTQKNGVSKNEEIQALDFRFTEESDTHSNWESQSIAPTEEKAPDDEHYVRDSTGRASWKMVPLQHQQPASQTEDPPRQEEIVEQPSLQTELPTDNNDQPLIDEPDGVISDKITETPTDEQAMAEEIVTVAQIDDSGMETDQLNQELDPALDQSNQEEPVVETDQSNQEEPTVEVNQSNQEEPEVERDQSNQEEPAVEANQSDQEEPEVERDQSNQEEPTVEANQSDQEEPEVERDQSNQEEPAVEANQSDQEEPEVERDQSNEEEPAVETDQSNQELEPAMETDQPNQELEPAVERDQSNQEEPAVEANQSDQEEPEVERDPSDQEEPEVERDQSNQEEPAVETDQSNQEEPAIALDNEQTNDSG